MPDTAEFDAIVVGAGPVGLTAALALASAGVATAIIVPPPHRGEDRRTAALFPAAIALLDNLGVWERCRRAAEPLRSIRVVDGSGALIRAPEVLFRAEEAGLDSFGFNVPNASLTEALEATIAGNTALARIESGGVTGLDLQETVARVRVSEGGTLAAALVVGADGRNSICRAAAGIATSTRTYDQMALACSFTHGRDHRGISTEIHTSGGPLTTVPLPGRASSLVWVERPSLARRLAESPLEQFREALEHRLEGLLGAVGGIGPRAIFPLSSLGAATLGQRRVALAGEAGHVIPPIAAQGLNLGLRDAATLADHVSAAHAEGRDIGGQAVIEGYARARAADVAWRTWSVDILNRSLIVSEFLPVHLARGAGLFALSAIGPLRRRVIRAGLGVSERLPRLMRPAPRGVRVSA